MARAVAFLLAQSELRRWLGECAWDAERHDDGPGGPRARGAAGL